MSIILVSTEMLGAALDAVVLLSVITAELAIAVDEDMSMTADTAAAVPTVCEPPPSVTGGTITAYPPCPITIGFFTCSTGTGFTAAEVSRNE